MELPPVHAHDVLTWIALIAQLVFLEGVLSLDNVAVLGTLVAPLPADRDVPWPPALRGVGRRINALLGPQQRAALRVGLAGAYLGRGVMLLGADVISQSRWLHVLGGLYLMYLAASHLVTDHDESSSSAVYVADLDGQSRHFWHVVLAVELTDLVFSLDNVVAAIALSRDILVVMVGVGLGILAVRVAAGVFTTLVQREPILEPATYCLLLTIGIRLILSVLLHFNVPALAQFALSASILGGALIYAHWQPLRTATRPLLHLGGRALYISVYLARTLIFHPLAVLAGRLVAYWHDATAQ